MPDSQPPLPPSESARNVVPADATVISAAPPTAVSSAPGLGTGDANLALVGQQLGHYLLEGFVGGGGMGAVFRAIDTTLNRTVAIKILSPRQADDEELLRRFQNEAQSAARLDHDHIARVYNVGSDRGVHYIAFEFVEGVNLRTLVEHEGPLPLIEAVRYAAQVADALAHASQRDVIHRDIKPSNIIITPDGQAKVVDMGLARVHHVGTTQADLTASGTTLGTFDYISPEQARDPRSADVRSDLYSLGCTIFFMLTGQPPFLDGTPVQKLLRHQTDEPPDLRTLRGEIPLELSRIVKRLLAKQPEKRQARPEELIAELSALATHWGVSLDFHPTSTPMDIPQRRQPGWMRHIPWAAPVVILLLVVLGLWLLSQNDSPGTVPQNGSGSHLEKTETVPPPSLPKPQP
jgi:serine/threonine-protein kinase